MNAQQTAPHPFCPTHADWNAAPEPASHTRARRFPFREVPGEGCPRPLLFVRVQAGGRRAVMPAVIDTGAHATLAPVRLCEELGLAVSSGRACPVTRGIGGDAGTVYAHTVNLGVLAPCATDADDLVFGPMRIPVQVTSEPLPFLLLGQADFLSRFAFRQVPRLGYFTLEWLAA